MWIPSGRTPTHWFSTGPMGPCYFPGLWRPLSFCSEACSYKNPVIHHPNKEEGKITSDVLPPTSFFPSGGPYQKKVSESKTRRVRLRVTLRKVQTDLITLSQNQLRNNIRSSWKLLSLFRWWFILRKHPMNLTEIQFKWGNLWAGRSTSWNQDCREKYQ